MSQRVVPKKNYYMLVLMCLGIVILTFSIVSIYNGVKNNKINKGYINRYVSELQYVELENYLVEPANDTFIYLTFTGDEDVYNLEVKLKKLIDNYELASNFIYVDLTDQELDETFFEKLNEKIGYNVNVQKLPVILYYKDGALIDSVLSDKNVFSDADFQKLLDNYEIAS